MIGGCFNLAIYLELLAEKCDNGLWDTPGVHKDELTVPEGFQFGHYYRSFPDVCRLAVVPDVGLCYMFELNSTGTVVL